MTVVRMSPIKLAIWMTPVWLIVGALPVIATHKVECKEATPYRTTVKLMQDGRVVKEWMAAEVLRHSGETWGGQVLWKWYQPNGEEVSVLVGNNATLIVE